jgi:DNA-binding SARP family transcriptional activator
MLARDTKLTGNEAAHPLRVFMLGRFEVEQGTRLIESEQWRSGKARNLFKILLNRRSYQISRQEVTELLWPELDMDRAANNLNQAVYSLRRTLEPDLQKPSNSAYLRTEGSKLQLNYNLIGWVDLEEFKRLYHQAQQNSSLELYAQAAALYSGEFLPEDLYEDWSVGRREAIRQEWAELLQNMADLYKQKGQEEKYQRCLQRVLESDFSHEESAVKLMVSLSETGRREEAMQVYRQFASKLQNRLNIEPLAATQELYQDIVAGRIPIRPTASRVASQISLVKPEFSLKSEAGAGMDRPRDFSSFSFNPLFPVLNLPEENSLAGPEIIGRQIEQTLWKNQLETALLGKGSLTLFEGEPGVGKTHLLETLAGQARLAGFQVLQITCHPEQTDLPLNPVSELLEQALSRMAGPELQECLKYCNPEISRLLPGMAHLFPAGATANPDTNPEAVFASAAQVLAWLSRNRRIVIVLDDLQYMPGPSLRMLRFWLNHPALRSLVFLAARRPGAPELVSPELDRLLQWNGSGTASSKVCHKLERLERLDLAQIIARKLSQPANAPLLDLILEITRGNPYLALELVTEWHKEGSLQLKNGQWRREAAWENQIPVSVSSYIKRIVGSLNPEAQILLGLAAVCGSTFSFEILRQIVLHRRDGAGWWIELDKTKLGQTLTEVTGCGLIEENKQEYRFTYPLLAETLVAGLSHSQRQCWREVIGWARKKVESGLLEWDYKYDQV